MGPRWLTCLQVRTPMPSQRRPCSAGRKQSQCTKREWCPASLVVLAMLRHGRRTEALTRRVAHTSTAQDGRTNGRAAAMVIVAVEERDDGRGAGGSVSKCPKNSRKWDSSRDRAAHARGIGRGARARADRRQWDSSSRRASVPAASHLERGEAAARVPDTGGGRAARAGRTGVKKYGWGRSASHARRVWAF